MKEESALYLEKARWHLANAGIIAAANIPEVAAREAYYATRIVFRRGGETITQI